MGSTAPKCPSCNGLGWTVEVESRLVAVCCRQYSVAGECCGDPEPEEEVEQIKVQCLLCADVLD